MPDRDRTWRTRPGSESRRVVEAMGLSDLGLGSSDDAQASDVATPSGVLEPARRAHTPRYPGSRSDRYLLGFLAVLLLFGSVASPYFFTVNNWTAILLTASVVSVLAVGQFLVIVTGGIDLSVGSVAGLASVVGAQLIRADVPLVVVIVATICVAGLIGVVNGILVVRARITAFIVTLAMLSIVDGVAYMAHHRTMLSIDDPAYLWLFGGSIGPFPTSVLIAVAVTALAGFMMAFTPFGRRLYAVGGNPETARLSGLPVQRDTMLAYVLCSSLAGLAALMIAGQLTEGSAIIGKGYELDSIAAVVVGGASLFGGTGNPVSAVVGGLVIAILLNIMTLLGIDAQIQLIAQGGVIIAAVFFTTGLGARAFARLGAHRAGRRSADSDVEASDPS